MKNVQNHWLTSHVLISAFRQYFGEYINAPCSVLPCNSHNKQPHTDSAVLILRFCLASLYRFALWKNFLFAHPPKSHLLISAITRPIKWYWLRRKYCLALESLIVNSKYKVRNENETLFHFHLRQQFTSNGFSFESQNVSLRCWKKTQHTPPNAIYMNTLSCVHDIHVCMCMCAESVYRLAHSNHCYWIIEQIAVCCCCRCCCFIQTIHNRVYRIHCDEVLSWYGLNDGSVYLYEHNAPNPTFIILSVSLFSPHVQCSLQTTEQNSTNILIMLCVQYSRERRKNKLSQKREE